MHSGNIPVANARITITALTTAQEVFAAVSGATGSIVVTDIHVGPSSAADTVIFQAVDNSPEYFRINTATNATRSLAVPVAFAKSEGLEVLMAGAATGTELTFFYWIPGAAGVGV